LKESDGAKDKKSAAFTSRRFFLSPDIMGVMSSNTETKDMRALVREGESISPHTTFGMGGMARYFCEAETPSNIIQFIRYACRNGIPYKIIAGGSNLVVSDRELPFLVIKVNGGEMTVADGAIEVDAGVPLMSLIETAIKNGYGGLETLSGIPGSVGGAIYGNAAAYGQAISERLVDVSVYDPEKDEVNVMAASACGFGYRESAFKHELSNLVILSARFWFEKSNKEGLRQKSEEIIEKRKKKYIPGVRTPGSFFKNLLADELPQHILDKIPNLKDFYGKVPAWYFLNEVGARGMRHGGLRIADFHGNYIINDGNATYEEVRELASLLKQKVREKFGVELEEEIRYLE